MDKEKFLNAAENLKMAIKAVRKANRREEIAQKLKISQSKGSPYNLK